MIQRHEAEAWLGPALTQLNPGQIDRVHAAAESLHRAHPGPHNAHLRDAALSAAVQYLLGELTVDDAGRDRAAAREAEQRAHVVALQVAALAAEDGMADSTAARRASVDPKTLLKYMGR